MDEPEQANFETSSLKLVGYGTNSLTRRWDLV